MTIFRTKFVPICSEKKFKVFLILELCIIFFPSRLKVLKNYLKINVKKNFILIKKNSRIETWENLFFSDFSKAYSLKNMYVQYYFQRYNYFNGKTSILARLEWVEQRFLFWNYVFQNVVYDFSSSAEKIYMW